MLRKAVGGSPTSLGSGAPSVYETLVLSQVILEYIRINGNPVRIALPSFGRPNYGGTGFNRVHSYEIDFPNGKKFFFAQNIYIQSIASIAGDYFETDVIVLRENPFSTIISNGGYPFPEDIHSVYECKFGAFKKSHLRELIGTKRHLTYLNLNPFPQAVYPFGVDASNCCPDIPVILFRPHPNLPFFSPAYANHFSVGLVEYI